MYTEDFLVQLHFENYLKIAQLLHLPYQML